jgi:hypothetical protein
MNSVPKPRNTTLTRIPKLMEQKDFTKEARKLLSELAPGYREDEVRLACKALQTAYELGRVYEADLLERFIQDAKRGR